MGSKRRYFPFLEKIRLTNPLELEHAVENVGENVIHSLIFEFKKSNNRSPNHPDDYVSLTSHFSKFKLLADNSFVRAYEVVLEPEQRVYYFHPSSLIYTFQGKSDVQFHYGKSTHKVHLTPKKAFWFESANYEIVNFDQPTTLVIMEVKNSQNAKL